MLSLKDEPQRGQWGKRRYLRYHFLFCQAMSFWPCSWYASMLLSILLPVLPNTGLSQRLAACLCLSTLPVSIFLLLPLTLLHTHNPQLAAEEGVLHVYFLPLNSRPVARCGLSLHTHFCPHGQQGAFSVALGLCFQKTFPSPNQSELHVWRKLRLHFSNQKCWFWRLKHALWNTTSTNTQTT